ncbi:MAG: DUF222 domain-containing protein [Acidimicrobiales bacterium]
MHTSVIERRAMEIEASMLELAASIDPDAVPASEAPRLFKRMDRIARAATAARMVLARRVDDSLEWRRRGFRSAAEFVAAAAGTSLSAARSEMEVSHALRSLLATRERMLDGSLSAVQGTVIAGAAAVNPGAETALIEAAGRSNLQELREHAGRARAAADADPMATHARIHGCRRVTRHTDAEGALHLHGQGTVDEGAVILAELDRLTDEIFRERRSTEVTETRDAYVWDALVRMAQRSRDGSGAPVRTNPRFLGLLRVDVTALRRGRTEGDELCEISGVGPVPVRVAQDLLGEATLKLVITRGVDVRNVTSLGRGPTAAMRYALAWTSPTCSVEGCSRTIVEYDHRNGAEFAQTRHTRLDETDPVCTGHHDLHTNHGWALITGTGKRPMVPRQDPRHPLATILTTGPPRAGP